MDVHHGRDGSRDRFEFIETSRAFVVGLRIENGQVVARLARIALATASSSDNKATYFKVGADANTVGKWRRRFAAHCLDGLFGEARPGTPHKTGSNKIADTIRRTLEMTSFGVTHRPLRLTAKMLP